MADNDAPGSGPVWTPGVRLAGFITRTIIYCYTQNMKALGLRRRRVFMFFHCKSMGANDPRGGAIFDPRGTVGRKEDHYTLLHKNTKALGLVVSEKIFMFFP